MAKKIIFFSTLSLLLFLSLSNFTFAADRPLEIIYPAIPGVPTPENVATGLPDYIKYIFQLSIIITGFVIFAALVYSGIQYLVSTGDPAKLTDSREGIFSAFLGAIILLSAYIIFNTINPQLTILKLPPVGPLEGVVVPGVYICNYTVPNIGDILNKYLTEKGDPQIEATKELRKIMANPEKDQVCPRVNFSDNLENFTVNQNNTIFIVPSPRYVYNASTKENEKKVIYEFGIVLHEKDGFEGQCKTYPKTDSNNLIYSYNYEDHQIEGYKAEDLGFTAKSVTVFKKPSTKPSDTAEGIVLYSCFDYNRTKLCPKGVNPALAPFRPGGNADILGVMQVTLGDLAKNTRSVKINPKGSYFALFFDGTEAYKGNCAVVKSNDPNIIAMPIDKCGDKCSAWTWVADLFRGGNKHECIPCLRSMTVIKGEVL
jgi:hypothetical protein